MEISPPQCQSEILWNRLYLGITVVGIGLLVGKWAGLPLIRNLSAMLIASFIVGVYAVTSLLHWYYLTR